MDKAKCLMLVNNSLEYDSRVNRSFETTVNAGYAVDLFGVGKERKRHPNGGLTIARDERLRNLLQTHVRLLRAPLTQKPKVLLRLVNGYARLFLSTRVRGIVAFGFVCFSVLWRLRRKALNRHFLVMLEDAILLASEIKWWKYEVVHVHDARLLPFAKMVRVWSVIKSRVFIGKAAPVRIIYDVHESVGGQGHLFGKSTTFMALLEKKFVAKDMYFSYVCKELANLHLERDIRAKDAKYSVVFSYPSRSVLKPLDSLVPGPNKTRPLVVYSGLLSSYRGVETIVHAQTLCEFDLRIIFAEHQAAYVAQLGKLNDSLSTKGNLSARPFVSRNELQELLAEADLGVIPILRRMPDSGELIENHEIALTNKLFEYITAGLPVLVSDCEAQAEFVRSHKIGSVFESGDPHSFAEAFSWLIPRMEEMRERVASLAPTCVWETQTDEVLEPYRHFLAQ